MRKRAREQNKTKQTKLNPIFSNPEADVVSQLLNNSPKTTEIYGGDDTGGVTVCPKESGPKKGNCHGGSPGSVIVPSSEMQRPERTVQKDKTRRFPGRGPGWGPGPCS